jgi:hypothetical protein
VPERRNGNDTCAFSADQGWPKPRDELEVAQVVGGELEFVAARIPPQVVQGHDTGIVDEDMEGQPRVKEVLGEGIDGRRIGQVHRLNFNTSANLGGIPAGAFDIAGRHDHPCARQGERSRRVETKAGVTARDDGYFSNQTDARDDIRSGRGGGEAGVDRLLHCRHARGLLFWTRWRYCPSAGF